MALAIRSSWARTEERRINFLTPGLHEGTSRLVKDKRVTTSNRKVDVKGNVALKKQKKVTRVRGMRCHELFDLDFEFIS